MLSKTFATRLRQAREEKGFAQVDVARELGVRGNATVHRWEAGVGFPGLDTVDQLANLLEKPAHWFFQEESNSGATAGATPKPDSTEAPKVNEMAPSRRRSKKLSGRPLCPPNPHPHWLAPTICEYPIAS